VAAGTSDWIDTDSDQQAGGAEDARYTGQRPAYRTAGTLMADPSELRAVIGMTPRVYDQLRPWVCALPVAAASRLNINTLQPEQAPLLAMLATDTLTVEAARQMLLRRPVQGWGDKTTIWAGSAAPPEADGQTAITSNWFDLRIDVTLPGTEVQEHALIDATRLPVRLVSRQWGDEL
jgi:general secretion pathway protein K